MNLKNKDELKKKFKLISYFTDFTEILIYKTLQIVPQVKLVCKKYLENFQRVNVLRRAF